MMYMNFQKKEKINFEIKKLLEKRKKYKLIKKKTKKFQEKDYSYSFDSNGEGKEVINEY